MKNHDWVQDLFSPTTQMNGCHLKLYKTMYPRTEDVRVPHERIVYKRSYLYT